jgi:hypothetical protein
MSTFAVEKIEAIKGKQTFYKLLVNGEAPIDDFEKNLESIYEMEMDSIYLYMEKVANLQSLPKSKFRELKGVTGKYNKYKEYEFKSKHLRIYAMHHPDSGKIVVMGGYKNNQERDIKSFRSMKQRYLDSIE